MHLHGHGHTIHPITPTDGTILGIGGGAADGTAPIGAGVRAGPGDRAGHGVGTTRGTGAGDRAGLGDRVGDGIIREPAGIHLARFTVTIAPTAGNLIILVDTGHPTPDLVGMSHLVVIDTRVPRMLHHPPSLRGKTIYLVVVPQTITAQLQETVLILKETV